ncbi:MAG: annexin [Bacteroidales bacterium]|nr:annexin [Bacteroidales bacterium]MCQ2605430.1 annexin [Bacteroidales bacterium]
MTQNTKIWIWIAVATIVIAVLGVGGFFLLKKDNKDNKGNNNGGENANFTPASGNSNSGSNSNGSNTNSSTTDSVNVKEQAQKLKSAIYGLGTDSDSIYDVFDLIVTQEQLDSLLSEYESLTKKSFSDDLKDELKGVTIRNELIKKLDSKGLTMEFFQTVTEKQKSK